MDTKIEHSEIHKAVRNVMFNELGLDRAQVESMVRQEVETVTERLLEHHILHSDWFSTKILNIVSRIVQNGVRESYWTKSFEQYVVGLTEHHIKQMITEQFTINIEKKED